MAASQRVCTRIRELAQRQDLSITDLYLRLQPIERISLGVVRRYWYNTADGLEHGPPLERISLRYLGAFATALGHEPQALVQWVRVEEERSESA